MGFCPKCGEKQDNDEAKFCQKCGVDMGVNSEVHNIQLSDDLNCIYCGSEIPEGSNKCPVCGNYLDLGAIKNTRVLILGYIISILGLLLVSNYVLFIGMFFAISGVLSGLYLITRKNTDINGHGIIIMIISLIDIFLVLNRGWMFFYW